MIKKKYAKQIYAIICDDVRYEQGNKISLMGLYQKDIIFNELPAFLPKLHLVVFFEDIKETFSKTTVSLIMPDEKPIELKPIITADLIKENSFFLVAGIIPLRALKAGQAKFEIYIDDSSNATIVKRFEIKKRN